MNILTLITKRSVREPSKEKKFLKFFSLKTFKAGNMIEIINGNKKSKAIILKCENAMNLKEEIRSGNLELKKLIFSKTGELSGGKIFDNFEISDIKKFLKNGNDAKKIGGKNLVGFFPKSAPSARSTSPTPKTKKGVSDISSILQNSAKNILNREKTYHNETQEVVDTIRTYFHENSRYGYGSFSYYIGMFKKVPMRDIRQIFAEVQQTKKSIFDKKRLFWYRIGKFIKEKNNS